MTAEFGFGSDDRGVSDVVGYVLIFSLIVATVGVVTTVGFSTLEDRQDAERVNNVERAFDVFANNMEDVYRGGAPSRATEMRLAGGTLSHGEPVTITIEADDETVTVVSRPLVYSDGDSEIVYTAGAVLRSDDGGSIMLKEPPFRADRPTALIPLIETFRTSGPSTVSVDGTIRVTSSARTVNTTVSDRFADADDYTITVDSPRTTAWTRYFESQNGFDNVNESGGTVEADIGGDSVVAPRFPVRIRFDR